MRRREFIRLLGGALAAQAIPANAQEPVRVRAVGALMGFANDAGAKARTEAFEKGLESEGWSLGQNLRIEYRYAEGDSARMQALASMARPGGNITGFTVLHASIAGKYLEILKEMVPQLARVSIMYKPHSLPDAGTFFSRPFIESATKLKVRPITAEVHDASEIEN